MQHVRQIKQAALARMLTIVCCALLLCVAKASAQSALDGFDPGANNNVHAIAVQADGHVVVGGQFTTLGGGGTGNTTRNRIGRLNPDGSLDAAFNPGASNTIYTLAVQADGKILVGGSFNRLGGGGTGTARRSSIGRLNADGSLDTTFDPGANREVRALAVQSDGKILVGGDFNRLGGGNNGRFQRSRIGRLNPDGSLDTAFDPGANGNVLTFAVQADGKVLIGGEFTTLGGGGTGNTTRNRIGRLNADGSLDTTFDPGANNDVLTFALQADGHVLVGGQFSTLGGGGTGTTPRLRIARLNPDGSLDATFNPGANNNVAALAVQADGKVVAGGQFTGVGGGTGTTPRNRIARLNMDGSLDAGFNPGANGEVLALAVQSDGKSLVCGLFSALGGGTGATPRNFVGRLNLDGSLDVTFNPGTDNIVHAIAVQPDGKILVGGLFSTLGGGGTGTTVRFAIGRLNVDGSLDTSFNPVADGQVFALAVQADGKILVGGNFIGLGSGTGYRERNRIGRLNPDGSVDTTFNPGANGNVYAFAVQADGKILVGGIFTMLGGGGTGLTQRLRIARLNPDGSLDANFNPGANTTINALAVQADGKILVSGSFTVLSSGTVTTPRNYVGRLNPDGTLDADFNPGANGNVLALAVQPDGKIVLSGFFTTLGGGGTGTTTRNYIGRLNPDGSLDATFNPGASSAAYNFAAQADGKLLLGGNFLNLSNVSRNHIGRLNANGTLEDFNPGANGVVNAIALQADGKILVGGLFTTLGGGGSGTTPRNNIGRLTNTDAALQTLTVNGNGTSVLWLRSGASPELARVTFDLSTDGVNYTPLGDGSRTAGGWHLTGLSLPTQQNIYIRARGFYRTGDTVGSSSIVESVRNAYVNAANSTLPDGDGDGPTHIVNRRERVGARPTTRSAPAPALLLLPSACDNVRALVGPEKAVRGLFF